MNRIANALFTIHNQEHTQKTTSFERESILKKSIDTKKALP